MPINNGERSKSSQLNKELQELIKRHGSGIFSSSIKEMGFIKESDRKPSHIPMITIEEAASNFFFGENSVFHHYSKTTKKLYAQEGRLFLEYCNKVLSKGKKTPLNEALTVMNISEYLKQVKKASTRNKKAAFLRTFIQKECSDYLEQKTMESLLHQKSRYSPLKILKVKDETPRFYKDHEKEEILFLARRSSYGNRNYAIIYTFLGSGIRLNEIHLKIKDVHPASKKIMVSPKGRKNQPKEARYLYQDCMNVLVDYINFTYGKPGEYYKEEDYKELYIFSASEGERPLSDSTIENMVDRLIKKAKSINPSREKELNVHSFRHTFAVNALRGGIDIYTISKMLGHSSLTSTEKYLHLLDDQLKNEIEKLPYINVDLGTEGGLDSIE